MKKKIVVAGAGHGGLVAAAILAKNGFDVTVYEKSRRRDLGHDWTDVFDLKAFDDAGLPRPPAGSFKPSVALAYANPKRNVLIKMPDPEPSDNSVMDRKFLAKYLVDYAEKSGVKFKFGYEITAPVADRNRVLGFVVKKNGRLGVVLGDLVIDSAGVSSPVRSLLPERFGIHKEIDENKIFTAYRGFFKKLPCKEPENKYTVFLYHMRKPGLSWVISEENYIDVLIGRFSRELSPEDAEEALNDLRQEYPSLGDKLLRGGEIAQIPVSRTLPLLVADGYAAIGDCAAMTIPMIGSGIANSMRAGRYLAEAVLADREGQLTRASLWQYEYNYFTNIGNSFVTVDKLRTLLSGLTADDIDYLLEKEIVSADTFAMNLTKNAEVSLSAVVQKVFKTLPKFPVIANAAKTAIRLSTVKKVLSEMPQEYQEESVRQWIEKYNEL